MALINEIKIVETELKIWSDRNAFVYSDTGIWRYQFEHRNDENFGSSWEDDADYIDNVQSDFLNEAGVNGSEINNTELFDKMAKVKFIKDHSIYSEGQETFVDCKETLPELVEDGVVEVLAI